MYQTIIDFFQTNKGEEFTLGIGYITVNAYSNKI